jgi:hypothetical protein
MGLLKIAEECPKSPLILLEFVIVTYGGLLIRRFRLIVPLLVKEEILHFVLREVDSCVVVELS